jgi:hypothetical protein
VGYILAFHCVVLWHGDWIWTLFINYLLNRNMDLDVPNLDAIEKLQSLARYGNSKGSAGSSSTLPN